MRLACKLVKLGSHPTNMKNSNVPLITFTISCIGDVAYLFLTKCSLRNITISKKIISTKLDNGHQAMNQRASNF